MSTNLESMSRRFQHHNFDVLESKAGIRAELEQRTAEFLKNKGKVSEVPVGASALGDYGVTLDDNGTPISGYPGIVWAVGAHRWQVFAGKRQERPVGFADTVYEGLRLQKRFTDKLHSKIERGVKIK